MKNKSQVEYKKTYSFKNRIKKIVLNALWLFFISMSIESFLFKTPYTINIGFMFLFYSMLVFPYRKYIYKKLNINITKGQKIFIILSLFFITAYLIKPNETNYLWCILSFILMILDCALVLLYSKSKFSNVHK